MLNISNTIAEVLKLGAANTTQAAVEYLKYGLPQAGHGFNRLFLAAVAEKGQFQK